MKYVGRLVILAQAALVAGWVNAGTVTVNGTNCGNSTGNVTVSATGDITVNTDDASACAGGTVTPGGPYSVTVSRTGTGTLGTITAPAGTGDGINCGADCSDTYASGSSVTLTASAPTGTDTFTWGGACSTAVSNPTCTITNITSAKSVTATYNAASTPTNCPTGVTCVTRPWPTIAEETVTMKGNAVMAIQVNTTAAGVTGTFSTNYTTGATASRVVAISSLPGDFNVGLRCTDSGLENTSIKWQQSGTDRACQIPANGTAWVNIKFTNCPSTSNCSFYMRNN